MSRRRSVQSLLKQEPLSRNGTERLLFILTVAVTRLETANQENLTMQ